MKKILILLLLFVPVFSVSASKQKVKFSKCVDGDTARFIIDSEEVKIRFLGINTPEIASNLKEAESYGDKASNYTCKKLKGAKKIEIEYEKNSDKVDKYGRTLAYVFVDDVLLEKLILKKGYGSVKYVKENYKYYDDLIESEDYAKKKKLGIYSNDNVEEEEINKNIALYIKKYVKKLFANIFEEIFN